MLGRNGAGKTTALKSILGWVHPRSGTIKFMGMDIMRKPIESIARMGIGFVPDERGIFTDMTVRENLQVPVRPVNGEWTIDDAYELFPVLRKKANVAGGSLSGGEQRMLAVARTLMISPKLLLLDEPTGGLAPIVVNYVALGLHKLKERGISMLFSEHNVKFALNISERAYILEKGMVRYQGSIEEFQTNQEISRKYLTV
jgi:branched-chain amino acid transport system ATP-binding protein